MTSRWMRGAGLSLVLACGPVLMMGCDSAAEPEVVTSNPSDSLPPAGSMGPSGMAPPSGGSFQPGGPAGAGPGAAAEGGPEKSEMGLIMVRIGQGPQSLTNTLKDALAQAEPDWAAVLAQATEYADLAKKVSELQPPKGTPESWTTLSAEYLSSANRLKAAAEKQDLTEATAAHGSISASCMACHREHRVMGPGGGGFRPPGGPGGPGAPPASSAPAPGTP